jgi:hypothetical protein
MYGLVIHANIVSMIIDEHYIWSPPGWLIFIFSFLVTFLHMVPFIYFYVNRHLWYHVFVKLGQLLSFSLILLFVFLLFKHTSVLVSTKYILVPVILAADVLYLYEAVAVLVYKKTGIRSIFIHDHEKISLPGAPAVAALAVHPTEIPMNEIVETNDEIKPGLEDENI